MARFVRRAETSKPDKVVEIGDYRLRFFDRFRGSEIPDGIAMERLESYLHIEREFTGVHFVLAAHDIRFRYMYQTLKRTASEPDVILETWSGGAHCCFTTYVVSLGDSIAVDVLETNDADVTVIPDRNGGAPRLHFPDTAFAYWNASFGASPAPEVHLAWKDGSYGLDVPRMRRPAWTVTELNEMAGAVMKELVEWGGVYEACPAGFEIPCEIGHRPYSTTPPSILWDRMLERIYSGNARDAIAMFEASWPESLRGRKEFWSDFKARLISGTIWKRFDIGRRLDAGPVLGYVAR